MLICNNSCLVEVDIYALLPVKDSNYFREVNSMEFIGDFINFLAEFKVTIPLTQLFMFILLNSLCMLLAKYKLGLLISYCFVIYWAFIINMSLFVDKIGGSTLSLPIFAGTGLILLVFIIIGLFQEG